MLAVIALLLLLATHVAAAQNVDSESEPRAAAQIPRWLKDVPGGRMQQLSERVFSGNIVLYRAGKPGADAILLVHGLGQNGASDWQHLIPVLAEEYDVYAVDLPGFGRSDKGNHLYSPQNFVKVIKASVTKEIGRPFILIGHSMGAAIALAYADRYPEQVNHLVLVDMAGVLQRSVYAATLGSAWARTALRGNPATSAWIESLMQSMLSQLEDTSLDTSMVLNFASMRSKFLNGDPNRIAGFALVEHDFSAALRNVSAPTLVIWGRNDNVAPLRTGQLVAATIPGARLAIVDNAGHTPQLEQPDEFNAIVMAELQHRLPLPAFAIAASNESSERVASCNNEQGVRYSGHFERITLNNCKDVEIVDAYIGSLNVNGSDVRVVNSRISRGIEAVRSALTLTAGAVDGNPALMLSDSSVDAAGTRFDSPGAIARNSGESNVTLRFSVAELVRNGARRYAHQVVGVPPRSAW